MLRFRTAAGEFFLANPARAESNLMICYLALQLHFLWLFSFFILQALFLAHAILSRLVTHIRMPLGYVELSRPQTEHMLEPVASMLEDYHIRGSVKIYVASEVMARVLTGKSAWDEMKQNALAASDPGGAAVLVADQLKTLATKMPGLEIHMVGHSAGSILLAPVVKLLTDRGLKVQTCTLWAPACTVDLFRSTYLPAMQKGTLGKLAVFALNDKTERDDNCGKIYNKSSPGSAKRRPRRSSRGMAAPTRVMIKWCRGIAQVRSARATMCCARSKPSYSITTPTSHRVRCLFFFSE